MNRRYSRLEPQKLSPAYLSRQQRKKSPRQGRNLDRNIRSCCWERPKIGLQEFLAVEPTAARSGCKINRGMSAQSFLLGQTSRTLHRFMIRFPCALDQSCTNRHNIICLSLTVLHNTLPVIRGAGEGMRQKAHLRLSGRGLALYDPTPHGVS
jgi:hypothetical protein